MISINTRCTIFFSLDFKTFHLPNESLWRWFILFLSWLLQKIKRPDKRRQKEYKFGFWVSQYRRGPITIPVLLKGIRIHPSSCESTFDNFPRLVVKKKSWIMTLEWGGRHYTHRPNLVSSKVVIRRFILTFSLR